MPLKSPGFWISASMQYKAPHRSAEDPLLLKIVEPFASYRPCTECAESVRARKVDEFVGLRSARLRLLDSVHIVLRPMMPLLDSPRSTYFAFTDISITATGARSVVRTDWNRRSASAGRRIAGSSPR